MSHEPLGRGVSNITEPPIALATFLETLSAPPQLLALGEPTHSVDLFPALRNEIFRILVENYGYRSIALESDIIAGMRVNTFVTANHGQLTEVLSTGFSHDFGMIAANRTLLEWMRAFNAHRPPDDHVRFYGFDAPLENLWAASPRASLLALHTFLSEHLNELPKNAVSLEQLCGDDAPWTNPAAAMDPAQSVGDGDNAKRLRLLADDLIRLLRTEMPHLITQAGYWEAALHARTAAGLLAYHATIADRAPNRVARMLALRDLMMADNLSAIAEREAPRGPTLVFAHNVHLQRPISTMRMRDLNLEWWGAGAHMDARLGNRYAFIASYLKSESQTQCTVPIPSSGISSEPRVRATLFTANELRAESPEAFAAGTASPARVGYFPLEPRYLSRVDGVLLVNDPDA